jgi:hypothetical protein
VTCPSGFLQQVNKKRSETRIPPGERDLKVDGMSDADDEKESDVLRYVLNDTIRRRNRTYDDTERAAITERVVVNIVWAQEMRDKAKVQEAG